MTQGDAAGWRPGAVTSLTRFWVVSLLLIVLGGVVGFAAASSQTPKATATASLVLSDPGAGTSSSASATQFADQVAIIKLSSTAKAAAALLQKRLPSAGLTQSQLEDELAVTSGTSNQLVDISVTDTRPAVALAATTAVVDTYVAQAQKRLDDNRNAALQNNQNAIDAVRADINVGQAGAAQNQAAIAALQQARAQLIADPSAADGPYQAYSPATLPTASRLIPPAVGLVAGLLVGLVAAMLLTRFLAQARQRFGGRFEPELIFSTPLLADVPSFAAERLPSDLPVVDSATSSVAEAYRFATTAVTAGSAKIVAVVSAASSEGKSSCAANLAVTAAYQGANVLVIDADFEGKGVSFLLGQDFERKPGLLDVLDGTVEVDDVLVDVPFAAGLSLLTGGHAAGYDWPDVLSTHRWPQLAERLAARFDLIVIDLPPFLQIAYAVPIVRAADGVVVVIPHKSSVQRAAELAERLRFVGVESLGYLYVKAPLRKEVGLVSRLATDKERRPVHRTPTAIVPEPTAEPLPPVPAESRNARIATVALTRDDDGDAKDTAASGATPPSDPTQALEGAPGTGATPAGEKDAAPPNLEQAETPQQAPGTEPDITVISVRADVLPAVPPTSGTEADEVDEAAENEPDSAIDRNVIGGVVRVSLLAPDSTTPPAAPGPTTLPAAAPAASPAFVPASPGSRVELDEHGDRSPDEVHDASPAEVPAGASQRPVRKQVHTSPRPSGSRKSRPRR